MKTPFTRDGAAVVMVIATGWLLAQPADVHTAQAPAARPPADRATTPRTPDGHPDLSGLWGGGGGGGGGKPDEQGNLKITWKVRPCHPGQECAVGVNLERDSGIQQRMSPNKPLYKPQFWEKVQYLDENGNKEDPGGRCYPAGVPRMGPPTKIYQHAADLVFLYQRGNTFRIIPIGRSHDPINSQDQTWMGDSVARWEGDTLVVDVVGLTDETWLGWPGYFHTNNVHVVERFRRDGNVMSYDVTVEDPAVLTEPWVMDTRTMRLNPNQNAIITEDLPCEERDWEHLVTKERG